MDKVYVDNEEATEAWNGVLFDRFVEYRDVVVNALGSHGERAIALDPPSPGDRVLDVGCGFGDTAQVLAGLVGPEGDVLGVDVAERFIDTAREEAAAAGVENVRFATADVEVTEFAETFDYVYSRMGTMFFANPVPALRNVRRAIEPGGRLVSVVWRRKLDNEWMYRAEQVVERYLEEPEESDEPTCGPGPFSMANADTVSDILLAASFEDIRLHRSDIVISPGQTIERAVAFAMAMGPAAELIRLAGDGAEVLRPKLTAELTEALSEFDGPNGVWAPSSTWLIQAAVPSA